MLPHRSARQFSLRLPLAACCLLLALLSGCAQQTRPVLAPTNSADQPMGKYEPFNLGEKGEYEQKLAAMDLVAAQQQYAAALALMEDGDIEGAQSQLIALTREVPELSEPYVTLGLLVEQNGNIETTDTSETREQQAQQWYERALRANRREDRAHHQLAVLARKRGDFETAERHYQAALEIQPDQPLYHRNIGILYDIYLGKPAVALEQYETYLDLVGEDEQVSLWIVDLKSRMESGS
ncbi:tetratricopeptide repeat protein [Allohahella marinimesophila]|uniref:Tetratricopeptide repeat protein n=1 Tax=Allohahella marinimesophila TaxID=1054972 RepID=A0ABP7PEX4_9GAMM